MNKKITCSTLVKLVLITLLVPPLDAHALALSKANLRSFINQKLSVTIELLAATPAELDSLNTYISMTKDDALTGMYGPKLTVELVRMEKGNSYLSISSEDNIREPMISFMIELDWDAGRIQREYTVLLNPPR